MVVHICNNCNKDFKYESMLKRHLDRKTKCINNNLLNTTIQTNNNIINPENNSSSSIFSILNNKLSKIEAINILITLISSNKNIIDKVDINNITNNDINNDIELNNKNININKYNCKKCNKIYANRCSLYTHNRLNRCKGQNNNINDQENTNNNKSGTTLNDILGININDSDNNIINNNPITNNDNSITNNNNNITNNIPITNIITINAFGCESLDNITTKQFTSIFKNFNQLHKMLYELGNMIYKNNNNMNFTKNNMNKNIVTYLSRDMEVKHISEREFIKDFEANIKKLCIELFHIHKNNISLDDLIEYMKSFLLFFDMLQENKINRIELKEQLKSIMDYVFRDENINEVIKQIHIDLQNNNIREQNLKHNVPRLKDENVRLSEYYSLTNKDKNNLCKVKDIAITKNIEDKTNILEKSIKTKYNKNLNNIKLENNKEKLITHIVAKIDNETGLIIDDRE
jgi:hypothetical protein